jgi:hypothetical protein
MPATRGPDGGHEIPITRYASKRHSVLTKTGSSVVGARLPNHLIREIERQAAREMMNISDWHRTALIEKLNSAGRTRR